MNILHELTFLGKTHFLYSLFFFGIGLLLVLYRWRNHVFFLKKLATPSHFRQAFKHYHPSRLWIKYLLLTLALLSIGMIFLRPALPLDDAKIEQEGRDLFIALDVSRSMLAQDLQPNRLEFAKKKIKDLIDRLQSERLALILFAGSATIQCPLTTDYGTFFMFLNNVDKYTIASGTTALDKPIKKTLDVLEKMSSKRSKLLVIITDGEDFSSDLGSSKQRASDVGLHIMTLGIGSEQGAPIPVFDDMGNQQGHQKDEKGTIVISRLNEGILRTLAEDTKGFYMRTTPDDTDIKMLIKTIELYEKDSVMQQLMHQVKELYPYCALSALFFLLIEWWL